jgi:hypothetical protein
MYLLKKVKLNDRAMFLDSELIVQTSYNWSHSVELEIKMSDKGCFCLQL